MQTEAAQAAYDACFANGLFPNSQVVFIAAMIVLAAVALWQARNMVKNF